MDDQQVFITPPQGDEIVLSLSEQKMVLHDTVRVTVVVDAQRSDDTSEEQLRTDIKAALRRFINADWRFTGVNRSAGKTARFENIRVQAIARVNESENVQLDERASAASTLTLQLIEPRAAYALPFEQVQKINADLRVALVAQAWRECDRYNASEKGGRGRPYRVALVEFADTPRMASNAEQMRAGRAYAATTGSGGYANAPSSAPGSGSDFDTGEEGGTELGVTQRFWVAAQVTLRAALNG